MNGHARTGEQRGHHAPYVKIAQGAGVEIDDVLGEHQGPIRKRLRLAHRRWRNEGFWLGLTPPGLKIYDLDIRSAYTSALTSVSMSARRSLPGTGRGRDRRLPSAGGK